MSKSSNEVNDKYQAASAEQEANELNSKYISTPLKGILCKEVTFRKAVAV